MDVPTSLSAATWFWLLVPMLSVVLLSVITYFTERKQQEDQV
ncbi:MAG: hypothetical protein ACQETE_04140 [Bacteroidota bacterium]